MIQHTIFIWGSTHLHTTFHMFPRKTSLSIQKITKHQLPHARRAVHGFPHRGVRAQRGAQRRVALDQAIHSALQGRQIQVLRAAVADVPILGAPGRARCRCRCFFSPWKMGDDKECKARKMKLLELRYSCWPNVKLLQITIYNRCWGGTGSSGFMNQQIQLGGTSPIEQRNGVIIEGWSNQQLSHDICCVWREQSLGIWRNETLGRCRSEQQLATCGNLAERYI